MAHPGTARPVSGEIVAAPEQAHLAARGPHDAIDADYVEIESAGPLQRDGMATFRGDAGTAPSPARAGPLFWLAGAVAIGAAFWVSGGHALMPAPSGMENVAPRLIIADVRSRAEKVDGQVALLVDGVVRNDGGASAPVPALIVTVLSTEGGTASYRLGTLRTPLAAGSKYGFSSRLDMPKDGVKTVTVTFDE